MRALVQRVLWAKVTVGGETVGETGPGLLVLLGVTHDDAEAEADRLARKIAKLRIFADGLGKMNLSVLDKGGAALVVSQFTLYGDASGGNRPSFTAAARPEQGEALYARFCQALAGAGVPVRTGRFGAAMQVALCNDGPVTLWLDTDAP
jgi:D-tyrosyl-tRNA(Tyr) deacylase